MTEELVLRITDLSRGGAGVSRESTGRVIFVPQSAPGDVVRVKLTEVNKRYAQAEILEILEPSPERQTPRCPAFGKCGGCQWQHLPYDLQWKTKSQGVIHALKRVNVEIPKQVDFIPATQIWEYRNRIQLRGEGHQIGFFKQGTRDLVPIQRCDIARRELNDQFSEIQKKGSQLTRPYKVEIEVHPDGKVNEAWNSRHSAGGFRQVHDEQNEKLKEWVHHAFTGGQVLFDFFGGSGNLSLPLVDKYSTIHCIDLSVPKIRPLEIPSHFHFHKSAVLPWVLKQADLVKKQKDDQDMHSAIFDPPREGLAESFSEIAAAVEKLRIREIIAIGCDPDSWARDVSRWVKRGWILQTAMTIDLFPQTPHIESVGILKFNRND